MKTSLPFGLVVALLVGLAGVSARAQTGAPAPAAPSAGVSVAVIDIPYIFKNHARFKSTLNDIKADIDGYKEFLDAEQNKIRKEAEKLEQFKPGTPEYKQIEETVARMRVELQLAGAKRQKEFMEREAMVYYNAYREIEAAITDFAVRNRIALVLRYSAEPMDPTKRETIMQGINRLVIYQSHLDITQYILETLNRGTPTTQNTGPAIPRGRTMR